MEKKARILTKDEVFKLFKNEYVLEEELIDRSQFFRRILQISY